MKTFGVALAFAVLWSFTLGSDVTAQERPSFTTGLAQTIKPGLKTCSGNCARVSAVGKIRAEDATEWVVPAKTHFESAEKAPDLFNQCGGIQLRSILDLDLKKVPVMDAGGNETLTAYFFADNYFEFYVNGKLLAVDAVPITPFNSELVQITDRGQTSPGTPFLSLGCQKPHPRIFRRTSSQAAGLLSTLFVPKLMSKLNTAIVIWALLNR